MALNDLQDLVRCQLCKTSVPNLYCDICHLSLCKVCVGEHLSDKSKKHKIVSFFERGSRPNYPKCPTHSTKQCELYCEQCDILLCLQCVSSCEHLGHTTVDILQWFERKKEVLSRELQELEKSIYPSYKEIVSYIPSQRADLKRNSLQIIIELCKHKDNWLREIDVIIKTMKDELNRMESKHLIFLKRQEEEINHSISKITESIVDLHNLLASNDINLVYEHKSRNSEFRNLPPQPIVTLPKFIPFTIDREDIYHQFGKLNPILVRAEDVGHILYSEDAESSQPDMPLLAEPRIIAEIHTNYGTSDKLRSVSAVNDTEIWTCGDSNMMKLYNLQDELVKSIKTKSENMPSNIEVTRNGDLVYTDYVDRTVNIVQNTNIREVVKLKGWIPRFVCCTSSDDLLVFMDNDHDKQSKIIRYCGSIEKQSIKLNDRGQPLYSYGPSYKYISENKNLDICVADWGASAVVVVNKAGKHLFTYTGQHSTDKGLFDPYGITTDSQSRILIADSFNNRIHILHQDGQFLCFIDNCGLDCPVDLCVDTEGNIFVAERFTGRVKKIQYQKQAVLIYQV